MFTRPDHFLMQTLRQYFPGLTDQQMAYYTAMELLYKDWNVKINVISRKDIDQFRQHHLIHSLAIGKIFNFLPGTSVMDAGTGGGFPGIPLAVMFPEVQFTLVDSIGKKIRVINEIAGELGLHNVTTLNSRFERVTHQFDFITGRAVSGIAHFYSMVRSLVRPGGEHPFPNGILYLTGGDVEEEVAALGSGYSIFPLGDFFPDDYFSTKKLVHIFA